MTDRNGQKLAVGDRVYVLPDKQARIGGPGWVRRFNGNRARVDNGGPHQAALGDDNSWSWSAWVSPKEVEKIESAAARVVVIPGRAER